MTSLPDALMVRAKALKLHGLLAHWEDIATTPWVAPLIAWEEDERARRGLERRLGNAHLGRFKPLADFDWHWPTQCDRSAIEDLMGLRFLREAANVVLVGPNGVGKTMIARNIAHQAVLAGHTVLFTSAGHMLNELAGADGDNALRHRLSVYARPRLLVVDEVGYLVLLQPSRRPALRDRLAPLRGQVHPHHHQPSLRRMGRGLPQRRLCRLPGRPPRPPRRDHRHPGRILPPQGGQRAQRTAPQGPQPRPQGHRTHRPPAVAITPEHIHDEAANPRLLVP